MREHGGAKRWDERDLERRLCHALDIARRTVERLAPAGYDGAAPDERVRPEKVIAETAMLLLAASTVDLPAVRARVDDTARLLIPHARSERMLWALCVEPALSLDYAAAHLCLQRIGYGDAECDALLQQTLAGQAAGSRERPPHRMLEQAWLQRGGGVASAARLSVLARPMDLLGGSRDDVYAFTHALMYVTDFNIAPARLPRRRAAILADAEGALARCLDDQDYDLGGEVLLTWPLTGNSWSPAAAFAFRVLARAEDQAGFLPAPVTRIDRIKELDGDRRSDYLLATAYHTIYVMGLVCAAALRDGRTPPATIPAAPRARRGSARRMLDLIGDDGRELQWREELMELDERQRDALSEMLLAIALCRRVKQRDFSGVAEVLRAGDALGLTDTPVASQSAELLERIALFAELTRVTRTA